MSQQGVCSAVSPWVWLLGRAMACAVIAMGLLGGPPAMARQGHMTVDPAAYGPVFEWILLDAETGQVLSEQNADVLTYPASLTKMMTLYLAFEALNQGKLRLDQRLYVSDDAARRAPSKLALTPGDSVPVHDLILGIVTKSANDAAAVLAEGLAGSEANFARYMTSKARQLGMQQTWYQNASGLPNPDQRTTARDVARLALALYHQFPREYRYFSTREFDFRGELVHSHNHLLEWYPGLDGIKTGFVNASGFNLAASAVRDGHRLIGVIMGGRSARGRDIQMASLLDQGFAVLATGLPTRAQTAPLVAAAPPPAAMDPVAALAAVVTAPVAAVATVATAPIAAIAAAAPAAPPPSPAAPEMAARPAAPPAQAVAAAEPEGAPRPGFLGNVAKHLSPVGKAEAAPLAHEPAASAGEGWAIQIGAFRGEAAAEQAARRVAALEVARGKPPQILAPAKTDPSRLYRARLVHFTPKGAQAACSELHRRGIACSIVRPAA
jgi:D-alanyl-D-alanine carboxypeptidase